MDVLSLGVQFNKKRFASDIQLFQAKKTRVEVSNNNASSVSLANLDFFKRPTTTSATNDTNDPHQVCISEAATANEQQRVILEECFSSRHDLKTDEHVGIFRKKHRIRVYGTDCPRPWTSFLDMLPSDSSTTVMTASSQKQVKQMRTVLKNVVVAGYQEPTPIQLQALPILCEGRDLIACAPTGSGKTLAYILPMLSSLLRDDADRVETEECGTEKKIRALIVSPNRELTVQIHRLVRTLTQSTSIKSALLQKSNLAHPQKPWDILISTPLRLVTAIKNHQVDLSTVQCVIIDEADKLFESGLVEQTDEILAACTFPRVQKGMLSATIDSHVEQLAQSVMKDPIRVVIGTKNGAAERVEQQLLFVGQESGKVLALRQMIEKGIKPPVLIFVETIDRAKELYKEFAFDNLRVDVMHSDRSQSERDQIIKDFRAGSIWILITTELLGRGIDFKGVEVVINYDFPRSVASYVHRIGRTGRAGRQGRAVTFFMKEDADRLRSIANVMNASGCEVPEWMLKLPRNGANKNKRRIQRIKFAQRVKSATQDE